MLFIKILLLAFAVVIFVAAWKMESGRRLILTPFLFAMYFEFMRVLPPFVAAETYAGVSGVEPMLVAFMAFISLVAGFVIFYFSKRTGPLRATVLTAERTGRLQVSQSEHVGAVALAALLCVSGLVFYNGLPPATRAVVGLAGGGGEYLASLVSDQRFILTKGAYFGGEYRGQGLFSAVQLIGWSMLLGYAALLWLDGRVKHGKLVLGATVVGAWVFVAGDGSRGPFINVLIFGIVVYSLRKPLRVKTVLLAFAAVVLLGVSLSLYSNKMYFISSDSGFFSAALGRVIERIFMGNGVNDVYVVDLVNEGALKLRWGQNHWRELLSALPGVKAPPPLSYELFAFMNPNSSATTFASGTYLSIAFIDFGWWGVVPIFVLVGVVIAFFQKRLLVARSSPWGVCVAGFLAMSMANILKSGFIGVAAQLVVFFFLCVFHRSVREVARKLGVATSTKVSHT